MKTTSVDSLRVASPCPTDWNSMKGDDRVRFCDLCHLNVYNFAELTRKEAAEVVTNTEGRLCGRLYLRADGTVITKDCPVGLRAIRRRVATLTGVIFGTLMSAVSVFGQKQSETSGLFPRQITISRQVPDSSEKAGSLSGKIYDQNNAAIVGAKITLTQGISDLSLTTESNEFGEFLIPRLTTGTYDIVITAAGFNKAQKWNVPLSAEEMTNLNVILTLDRRNVIERNVILSGFIATGPSLIDTPGRGTTIIR